jgi:DNA-binding protein H-NS
MSKYAEIQAKITELKKQANEIYSAEKKAAIAAIKEQIKVYDITAAELGLEKKSTAKAADAKPGRKTRAVAKAKTKAKSAKAKAVQFVGPNGETWGGGRGKRPAWVNEILAAGGDIEQYRVS